MAGAGNSKNNPLQSQLFSLADDNSDNIKTLSAVMHCDGGSRGNPGDAGIGVVINVRQDTDPLSDSIDDRRISEYIGTATNNVAEYSALLRGLESALEMGIRDISIFLDSELLVRQMNGIYKVKNRNLRPMWERAMGLVSKFDTCNIIHVRRELNKEADALVNQAIDEVRRAR